MRRDTYTPEERRILNDWLWGGDRDSLPQTLLEKCVEEMADCMPYGAQKDGGAEQWLDDNIDQVRVRYDWYDHPVCCEWGCAGADDTQTVKGV